MQTTLIRITATILFIFTIVLAAMTPKTVLADASCPPEWTDSSIVTVGPIYDAASDTTTFSYTVTAVGKDISHVNIQLGDCVEVALGTTTPYEIGTDPTTGVTGIKWDIPVTEDTSETFVLVLAGQWQAETGTGAIKGASFCPVVEQSVLTVLSCEPQETISNLLLTSMCSADPAVSRRWRVRNSNAVAVEVRWEVVGTTQTGTFSAAPGDSFFETDTVAGANTTKIFWKDEGNTEHSTVKASGGQACATSPALVITKVADVTSAAIGDTINYTIRVTNTGDVTLHNVTIVDAKLGLNANVGTLAPGATAARSGSYGPVSESDLPGPIVNTATGDSDETSPVQDSWSVALSSNPALGLVKSSDTIFGSVGQTVDYTLKVTNLGDVTLHNVTVIDAKLSVNTNLGSLAPGASKQVTASYLIGAGDYPGPVVNLASADSDETGPVEDTWTVALVLGGAPGVELIKTADRDTVFPGETVTYRYDVYNVGAIAFASVVLDDDKGGPQVYVGGDNGNGLLDPGEVWSYTWSTRLDETTRNVATVTAYDLLQGQHTATDDATVFVRRPLGVKFEDLNGNGIKDAGETNIGNWRILIKDMAFNIVYQTTTIASPTNPYFGRWLLNRALPEGNYWVVEEERDGWQQTHPVINNGAYLIHLYENGTYDLLSQRPRGFDGLSFGNTRNLGADDCATCPEYLVFQSDRADGNVDIYRSQLDGSDVVRLTDAAQGDIQPTWRFGGGAVAFASERDGNWDIWTMAPDGSGQVNVTRWADATNGGPASDLAPSWACDWIAFQSNRDGQWEIYKTSPDGLTQIRLTDNPASDQAPSWSPDGARIAFESNRDGQWELYLMDSDGGNVRRLTTSPTAERNPSWSADGQWLYFDADRSGNRDIWKINVATGEWLQLTFDQAEDSDPEGHPYCEYVFFETQREDQPQVYRMHQDGSEQQNVILGDHGPDFWFDALGHLTGSTALVPPVANSHSLAPPIRRATR